MPEVAERPIDQFVDFGDRAPYQPPQLNEDIKLSRYLFTAAHLITPSIARDRPHMKAGGLNVYNPCLNQSRDFIRRGRLVPLLINQHVPVPAEDVNDNDSTYFTVPLDDDSLRGPSSPFDVGGMKSKLAYPGQQITHILEGSSNVDGNGRLGIVEIPTLKGHEYKLTDLGGFLTDAELWKIQTAIFPDYPNLPFAIRPFTELIQRAIKNNTGDLKSIAEEMFPSCLQFEAWAIRHIEQTHQNMAQAAVKGYSSPYEETDLLILDQLEMQREDEHFKRTAQQAAASAQAAIDPNSLVALMRESSKENREMFMAGMAELMREWKGESVKPDQNTMAAAPIADLKAEDFDLSGERPREVHWKVWEKWQKDAAQKASE